MQRERYGLKSVHFAKSMILDTTQRSSKNNAATTARSRWTTRGGNSTYSTPLSYRHCALVVTRVVGLTKIFALFIDPSCQDRANSLTFALDSSLANRESVRCFRETDPLQ